MPSKKDSIKYISNCIICGKKFHGASDHKNRKSQTCKEDECLKKLMSIRQLARRPQDEESIKQRRENKLEKQRVRNKDSWRKYIYNYTANCIICGNEFSATSDHKNRKSSICANKECSSKLNSIKQRENHKENTKLNIDGYPRYIDFNGINYCLNKYNYYKNSIVVNSERERRTLHRDVWEFHSGKTIPDGYVVHHIDFNRLNNDYSNLTVMERGEHGTFHRRIRYKERGMTERERAHLTKITKDNNLPRIKKVCVKCGKDYLSARNTSMFCSEICKNRYRHENEEKKYIKTNCIICNKEFMAVKETHLNRKNRTTCSKECRGSLMSKIRSAKTNTSAT